jgi:hypothetical protein
MSEGNVRQWCIMLKDGLTMLTMKSELVGCPSVVSDDLVQSVDQTICERGRFTFSEHSREFPQISRTVLYEIIAVTLGYHKFCRMGPENAHR